MIGYLRNNEINRELWDNCIKNSPECKPYGFSWYLDIMSPGWEALTEDQYNSVFPVPGFRKYGIRYIATPNFLQQLGLYSNDRPAGRTINEFIDHLPHFYWLVDLCTAQKIEREHFNVAIRQNYVLDLSMSYDKLRENFTAHCRRNIEKSGKQITEITGDIRPAELTVLFQENAGSKIKGIKQRDYQRLIELMDFCIRNKKGKILGVRTTGRKVIYGIFVLETEGRMTMLFVVNTGESRERRTGYYVVNELIKESAGTGKILDFAGSSIPSIASFMESFGSKNIPFYRNYLNRLPWPLRLLR